MEKRGGVKKGEICDQDIYYMKKRIYFQSKKMEQPVERTIKVFNSGITFDAVQGSLGLVT